MPVRLRITLLFSLLVFFILSMVCLSVYFFFHQSRINTIKSRLTNRARTTARLLSQKEFFDLNTIRSIDSLTTISLKDKIVQAYDYQNKLLYNYHDKPSDRLVVPEEMLNEARIQGSFFFTRDGKEAVAYHYTDNNTRMVVVSAAEDTDGHANMRNLKRILILSFLTGNLIVLATGHYFSRRLLRPVEQITKDVAEISARNLVRRLQTGASRDEWHNLASTLNELLNRLQDSFEMQRRFIANASHELSTPLTSISSQLEVALQRERSADEYRKVVQSTYQDVRQLSKLTLTLLEFAKASGEAGGLEITSVRIDEVIIELLAQMVKFNPAYTISVSFENMPEDEEKLVVYGNKALLDIAIKNILVNACKYSPDNTATVRLESGKDVVNIIIEDKGPGIPAEAMEHIFQPFYRIESNSGESADGFGLGLSLASRIIKLHKGTIQVNSTVSEGSSFCIQLPVASL